MGKCYLQDTRLWDHYIMLFRVCVWRNGLLDRGSSKTSRYPLLHVSRDWKDVSARITSQVHGVLVVFFNTC